MSQPRPIMGRLKAATDDLHRFAEGRELQRSLVKGTLPRDLYAAFLGQMHLVHRALERGIARVAAMHPAFGAVVRDHHRRETQLSDDLRFLGADTTAPLDATAALIERIDRTAAEAPVALLGMLYVLEGSTNGSKFIARSLVRAYGLQPGPGLSYLDPHGDLQRPRWAAFRRDMDAVAFSAAESAAIEDAARACFEAVARISDELMEPVAL